MDAKRSKKPSEGERTPYRGVRRLGPRSYLVRGEWVHPKTERKHQYVRTVVADSAEHAAMLRRSIRLELEAATSAPARLRVDDAATSWIRSVRDRVRPSTLRHYAETLDNTILPHLGDYFVDAVTREDIVAWKEAQTGKPGTIAARLKVLRLLFVEACELARVPNPTAGVKAPREIKSDENSKVLTPAELGRLVDHVVAGEGRRSDAREYGDIVAWLAWTGTRYSEAAALQWADLDLEAGSATVRRAYYRGAIGPTKTGRSRVVPIAAPLGAILGARRARTSDDAVWVFPGRDGAPVRQVGLTEAIAAACRTLELRKVSPHAFRHTWISHAHASGASPRAIRAVSGHAATDVHDTYGHVTLEERRAVVRAIDALRNPGRPRLELVRTETVGRTVGEGAEGSEEAEAVSGSA